MDRPQPSRWAWQRTNHKLAKRKDGRPLAGNNPDTPCNWRFLQQLIQGGRDWRLERSFLLQGNDSRED